MEEARRKAEDRVGSGAHTGEQMTPDWTLMAEEDKILLFNRVLSRWREPGLLRVRPSQVRPGRDRGIEWVGG